MKMWRNQYQYVMAANNGINVNGINNNEIINEINGVMAQYRNGVMKSVMSENK